MGRLVRELQRSYEEIARLEGSVEMYEHQLRQGEILNIPVESDPERRKELAEEARRTGRTWTKDLPPGDVVPFLSGKYAICFHQTTINPFNLT
jgi:hypothetical protein